MKKVIIFSLLFALSSQVFAINVDKVIATKAYISSYSNATLFVNLEANETINIYTSGKTKLFCTMVGFDQGGTFILAQRPINMIPINVTVPKKDLYIVLCIKSSGFNISGDNYLIIEKGVISKRSKEELIDSSEIELINKSKEIISDFML